jgi:radical S-adenosyl methionine domain-containing protein 2
VAVARWAPVETVNFHLWQPCNMSCRFCFATFRDVRRTVLPEGHLRQKDAEQVVCRLAEAGFLKITFAGGEPLLCPWIADLIRLAARSGLTTALVTNGSLLSGEVLNELNGDLDWITISIDSILPRTLTAVGRRTAGSVSSEDEFRTLCEQVKEAGFRLKINTVVTAINWQENMTGFIIDTHPERWKIFQVLPIEGQNSGKVDPFLVTNAQFRAYVTRAMRVTVHGVRVVPEDNDAMTGSYAMVDPAGRFFDGTGRGGYTYSDPILSVGVAQAIAQITISREKFLARGGLYHTPSHERTGR